VGQGERGKRRNRRRVAAGKPSRCLRCRAKACRQPPGLAMKGRADYDRCRAHSSIAGFRKPAAVPDVRESTTAESLAASASSAAPIPDVYFSADIETDGPIPGPFSLLSFALVVAGHHDGREFHRPLGPEVCFYREVRPISDQFDPQAMAINLLDRDRLTREGIDPSVAMTDAAAWVQRHSGAGKPILVAFPLSFDWTWLYWYFVRFSKTGSPFGHSSCFDIKTAFAVKARRSISDAARSKLPAGLRAESPHTHNALDDAREQAEVFARIMEW